MGFCLKEGVNPRKDKQVLTDLDVEALMTSFIYSKDSIKNHSVIKKELFTILESCIFKYLNSESEVLKTKACHVLANFGHCDVPEGREQSMQQVCQLLCQHI